MRCYVFSWKVICWSMFVELNHIIVRTAVAYYIVIFAFVCISFQINALLHSISSEIQMIYGQKLSFIMNIRQMLLIWQLRNTLLHSVIFPVDWLHLFLFTYTHYVCNWASDLHDMTWLFDLSSFYLYDCIRKDWCRQTKLGRKYDESKSSSSISLSTDYS